MERRIVVRAREELILLEYLSKCAPVSSFYWIPASSGKILVTDVHVDGSCVNVELHDDGSRICSYKFVQ